MMDLMGIKIIDFRAFTRKQVSPSGTINDSKPVCVLVALENISTEAFERVEKAH